MERGEVGAEGRRLQPDEEVEVYRGKLSLFLTTDASLIPCWERNSMTSCQAWLHLEPTAVLASTLLDIYLFDMGVPSEKGLDGKVSKLGWNSGVSQKLPHSKLDDFPSIDWTIFKPPRRYHPSEFSRSLHDTPQKYRKAKMECIRVPNNMRLYLGGETKRFEACEWDTARLDGMADAVNISLLDIMAFDSTQDQRKGLRQRVLDKLSSAGASAERDSPGAKGEEPYSNRDQETSPRVLGTLSRARVGDSVEWDSPGAQGEQYSPSDLNPTGVPDLADLKKKLSRSVSCYLQPYLAMDICS